MRRDEITLEICSNVEWLRDNAGVSLDRIEDGMEDDAAKSLQDEIARRIAKAGYNYEWAKRQRITFHGWNGANTFRHKLGAVGTFDDLSAEQEAEIFAAIAAAVADVESRFAKTVA